MNKIFDNIIISPHVDDAFLSLGGFLSGSHRKNKIINIFSYSNYAVFSKDLTTETVSEIRRKEELLNCDITKTNVNFLGVCEGRLRGYKKWDSEPLWFAEEKLITALTSTISREIKTTKRIFFPMAIGHHTDHLIMSNIGLKLAQKFDNIQFYEDMPYVAYNKLRRYSAINPILHQRYLSSELLQYSPKAKSLLCSNYESQLKPGQKNKILRYGNLLSRDKNMYYERVFSIKNKDILKSKAPDNFINLTRNELSK